jgi:uncharacterized protein YdbL (DUF1318 family)
MVTFIPNCSSAPATNLAEDKYQITEITFEQSGSWGVQYGYKVVLRNDGTAEYVGDINAKRTGKYRGQISKDQFERLAGLMTKNNYFMLKDKYRAPVTDTETITTSVVYNEGRKVVENYGGGGSKELSEIEQAIVKAIEQIMWEKDES